MTTFLFWNINKNKNNKKTLTTEIKEQVLESIVNLCHLNEVDVLILAESCLVEEEILSLLNSDSSTYLSHYNKPESRSLQFFFKYPSELIKPVFDDNGISIRRIVLTDDNDILVVALHLPSRLRRSESDLTSHSRRIVGYIEEFEEKQGLTRTLVIGDFNMNPFSEGIVNADCFHAVMTQDIARKQSRKVEGRERRFFYNPMWGRMGDYSPDPPGTYYYPDSGYVGYFWNTYDQVLLRPDLLNFFSQENLKVISSIGEKIYSPIVV